VAENSYAPGGTSTDDGRPDDPVPGRRPVLVEAEKRCWRRRCRCGGGDLFSGAGIALHLFGFVVQQPRFSVVGCSPAFSG